jgi:hypothetical protein
MEEFDAYDEAERRANIENGLHEEEIAYLEECGVEEVPEMAPIEEIPFSFRGSCFRWKCKIEGPHAPHVVDHYDTVSYGALQHFCLGQEGNGLHIHVDHYYGGSPSMAARASGTYWQGEPDPHEDEIFEFTGRIWPTASEHLPRVLITDISQVGGPRVAVHANLLCADLMQRLIPDGSSIRFLAGWRWHKSPVSGWVEGPNEVDGCIRILPPWDDMRLGRISKAAHRLITETGLVQTSDRWFASENEATNCVTFWRKKAGMTTPEGWLEKAAGEVA